MKLPKFWRAAAIGQMVFCGALAGASERAASAQQADGGAAASTSGGPGLDLLGRDPLKGMMTPRLTPAQPSPEAKLCADASAAPERRAESCGVLISSGKWQGEQISWAYANRCVAFYKLGQRDKARADCDKALSLEPKNLVALQLRGMMARDRGDQEQALAAFDSAVAFGLRNAALFLDRGNIFLARGDVDRALGDYQQAIALTPESATAYLARANARLAGGDRAGALSDGARAVALAPNNGPSQFTYGVAAFLAGETATAVAALRQARMLAPKDPYPALWLDLAGDTPREALAALAEGPWPGPVARYDLGAIDAPNLLAAAKTPAQQCEAAFYHGAALLKKGDAAAAAEPLRQALEICPKNFIEYAGALALSQRLAPAGAEKATSADGTAASAEPSKAESVPAQAGGDK